MLRFIDKLQIVVPSQILQRKHLPKEALAVIKLDFTFENSPIKSLNICICTILVGISISSIISKDDANFI